MLKQLTAFDASFLYLETAETPEHVGGLSFVELPEGYTGNFYEDYRKAIASRIRQVPFLHARVVELPLDIDHPFWVEVANVDLDYHVRHLTAPRPGGLKEVEELVAILHSGLLDRSRPLWQFHVIDGLASGQVAIYTKMHHAAMDGATSMALINAMYDPSPGPRSLPPAVTDEEEPADLSHVVQGLIGNFVRREIRAAQFMPELLKAFNRFFLPDASTFKFEPMPRRPSSPRTPFNVGITNQRIYAARTLSLPAMKKLGKLRGATLNDVVLAVCGGALRDYLAAKDALPEQSMTAVVPVSMRPGDSSMANQNGMYVCSLATDVADPLERLAAIHRSSAEQKKLFDGFKNVPLPDFSVAGLGVAMHRLVELYGRSELLQRSAILGNVLISNVPGPTIPLYIAGARIVTMYPCSIPFHGSALNITVESYGDRMDFGLIACRRAVPDLALLADGLARAFAELEAAAPTLH